jgi:hypothetical protein
MFSLSSVSGVTYWLASSSACKEQKAGWGVVQNSNAVVESTSVSAAVNCITIDMPNGRSIKQCFIIDSGVKYLIKNT